MAQPTAVRITTTDSVRTTADVKSLAGSPDVSTLLAALSSGLPPDSSP